MRLNVCAIAGVIASVAALSGQSGSIKSAPAADEVRGLWVLRTSLTAEARIEQLVQTAVVGGYNTLLVQVRGRGDAFYHSRVEPRAAELARAPRDFDPLAAVIARAHREGLRVHAWFNVNLVSSAVTTPGSREHIVHQHPEWLMVPEPLAPSLLRLDPRSPAYRSRLSTWTRGQSQTVEGLFVSPIPEASQEHTLAVVHDLVTRYALDGLHLDYVRYPTAMFDYSAASLAAFKAHQMPRVPAAELARLDGRESADPLIWTRTYPDAWAAYRKTRLTTLVSRIRSTLRAARPEAILSAAVLPSPEDADTRKLQPWADWAASGVLDVICPMAYAAEPAAFTEQVAQTLSGASGRPVWAGIGAWRLPVTQTADHVRRARTRGAAGILLFSYDGLIGPGTRREAYFRELRSLIGVDQP